MAFFGLFGGGEKATENAEAQFELGERYLTGNGVEKDLAEAAKCYKKAAKHGHPRAQQKLGRCYKYGWGVEKDLEEAEKWFRKAVELGISSSETEALKRGLDLKFIARSRRLAVAGPSKHCHTQSIGL